MEKWGFFCPPSVSRATQNNAHAPEAINAPTLYTETEPQSPLTLDKKDRAPFFSFSFINTPKNKVELQQFDAKVPLQIKMYMV